MSLPTTTNKHVLSSRDKKFLLALALREKRIRQARNSFWHFCKLMAPDFYQEGRVHLEYLCETLQMLYEGKLGGYKIQHSYIEQPFRKLAVMMPPRFGKTRTLILFCQWILGINPTERIIVASYNDNTASDFSRYVRDGIRMERNSPLDIVYSDIFPWSKIKEGYSSFEKWALEGQYFSYLGAGIGGSVTGKGATVLIVDDPIKDAETAFNDNALEKIWRWYTGTLLSRRERHAIEIINMTRWSSNDLVGRLMETPQWKEWYHITLQARDNESGEMLCPDIMDEETYKRARSSMDPLVFMANYHQVTLDVEGRLYKKLKTYRKLRVRYEAYGDHIKRFPEDFLIDRVIAYVDTADEGNDYLCAIVGAEYNGELHIIDVLYTKESMEVTERKVAEMLCRHKVNLCKIESNNGGRGFARNVQKIIAEEFEKESKYIETLPEKKQKYYNRKWHRVAISWFHQTDNKKARILSNSSYVTQHVYFPFNWNEKWPEFYKAINTYLRDGKNKHDDAPDALTGLVEMVVKGAPRARVIDVSAKS